MCISLRASSGSRFLSGGRSCSEAGSLSRSYKMSFEVSAETTFHGRLQPTSRSNSSGPARGSKMVGSISIPGASLVEGGTALRSVSGKSMVLWVDAWKAQFLLEVSRSPSPRNEPRPHFMVESTPPLLIVSLCSVKMINFANGYSNGESWSNGFEGNGVKKKVRPACDCTAVSYKLRD